MNTLSMERFVYKGGRISTWGPKIPEIPPGHALQTSGDGT